MIFLKRKKIAPPWRVPTLSNSLREHTVPKHPFRLIASHELSEEFHISYPPEDRRHSRYPFRPAAFFRPFPHPVILAPPHAIHQFRNASTSLLYG